ncbi:MAG: FAD-dependent oxidoreductase, partial [Gammaproteobacteria bacterium]|nr:FAD-dependent oxidoreductase [Gammaproteobacteria bacterium]
MRPEFDCVIVGAGLVGAATATALSRQGLRVAVIEKRSSPAEQPAVNSDLRALVLSVASQRILAHIGVWDRLSPHANRIRHIHVTDRGGFGAVRLDAGEAGLDVLGWACPADVLLHELLGAARDRLGEDLSWSTEFDGFDIHSDHVTVNAAGRNGASILSTRLLIGADGSDSDVRGALGIDIDAFDYAQAAIVANVEVECPREDTAYERFTRQGPLAMIPLGGRRYVSVQCLDLASGAAALELADGAYLAQLQRRFGWRLGEIADLGARRSHALWRRRARSLDAPRAVIIGNAANTVHPNAAQGLNLGLRDVSALALALSARPDPGDSLMLQTYARSRKADHARTSFLTDLLAKTFRSNSLAVTVGRRVA